jgi:LysR family glycine cleavage system transcriptional activator
VTAAAVSQRIRELEERLGVSLFERHPRGVAVTEAGRRYRDQLASAFSIIERATAEIDRASVDGPLVVSMPQSFAEHWLVPRLPGLAGRFPGLELTIEGTSRLMDFRAGQADAAIRFGPGGYDDLDSQFLCGDAVTVLAPAAQVRDSSDARCRSLLERATLLVDAGVTRGEPWHTWGPWLREAGIREGAAQPRIQFADSSLAMRACLAGAGFCVGRMSFAYWAVRERQVLALMPWRTTEYAYYLVSRSADRNNPRIAAFRAWLVEEVARFVGDVGERFGVALVAADEG